MQPSAKTHQPSAKAPRRKFNFTKKALAALPPGTNGQRAYYYDLETRGLTLAVSPGGKKVFCLYRKIAGRPERINLGVFPEFSIDEARGKAAELNGKLSKWKNNEYEGPSPLRRPTGEPTLAELVTDYCERWLPRSPKCNKPESAAVEMRWYVDHYMPSWRSRRLRQIHRDDVIGLHRSLGEENGKVTANRVLQRLRALFNWATHPDSGLWSGVNPASRIALFGEEPRERFLQPAEVPAFFKALAAEQNESIRDYVLLSLLTGARRGNVQSMRWDEINLPSQSWTIPNAKMKGGKSITVALTAKAMEIIERRMVDARNEWVFPSTGKTGHLVEPKTAWKRILKRSGIKDLRIHDLRRTLGSWQATQGTSLQIIGKSLGHKSLAATAIYSRLLIDPVRASVNKATDALLEAGNGSAKLLGDGNG